LLITSSI